MYSQQPFSRILHIFTRHYELEGDAHWDMTQCHCAFSIMRAKGRRAQRAGRIFLAESRQTLYRYMATKPCVNY